LTVLILSFIMLLTSTVAALAALTLVQALPPPEEHKSGLASTTVNGFEVVIVYATPEGGCSASPTSCGAHQTLGGPPDHKHIEATKVTAKASATPTASFVKEAPVATLKPNLHWDCDTKPAKNVIPVPPSKGSQMYYGINDPSKAGEYAWLTYYFNRPSVNLDHTDHITDVEYGPGGLSIHFASEEAWDYAVDTWSDKDKLVLITYTEGCGAYEKQDRCFFQVTSITWKKGEHSIVAKGKPTSPEEIADRGETEWGYYVPRGDGHKSPPGKPSPSATRSATGSKPTTSPGGKPGYGVCVPPVDKKYGLPTACFGNAFDEDLDEMLGSEDLTDEYNDFLDKIVGDNAPTNGTSPRRRGQLDDRCGWICDHIVEPVKDAFDAVQDALAISADIDKDFSFKIPDPDSKLLDLGLDFTTSPWGEAIQLFSAQMPSSTAGLDGHVNVYCVGCGASGTARLYGKAKWVPFKGITEGFIELSNDLQFAVKLGIDAEVSFSRDFNYNLFSVGLPGLSFGVITIGPRVDVGANIGLEASASGKLLAGAEMGLQNAVARLDFVNSDNNKVTGWEPFFTPVFEAEGKIHASASLGLPVGIHCGIKIAMFDLSAGIVDEPSIKATAEVAAKVGLDGNGDLEGGIVDTNGCKGIKGQLSWRNKLFVKITGFSDKNLLDTNDRVLAETCIPIGPQDEAPQPPAEPPATQPPAAEPPVAEPPAVDPPAVDPPAVDPPVAEPPTAEPPVVDPPSTEPPASEPPATEPPSTEPPVVEPPSTEPPVDDPPVDDPPVVDPPVEEPPVIAPPQETPIDETPAETPGPDTSIVTPTLGDGTGVVEVPVETPIETPGHSIPASQTTQRPTSSKPKPTASASKTRTASATSSGKPKPSAPSNGTRPGVPVKDENGLEFASLVGSSSSGKVASCSNGNMYMFAKGSKNTASCSDIWAFKDEALVADGSSRALHYYNNTMSVLGVSRLRIEHEAAIPNGGVIVAWAPHGQDRNDTMYLAVDPDNTFFYPLVCEYENGSGAKIFLAKNPSKGAEMLKSKDIQYSVTGGKVKDCHPLRLVKGASLTL
jgi:hypothetical protein